MICIGPIPEHLRRHDWYALHQAWLAERGLRHHDPAEAEAARADLTGADLTDAILTAAILTGADLTDATLTAAYLTRADLTDARLYGADLTGAYLTDARLYRVDLTNADLTDAYLTDARLYGATLTGAILPDGRTLAEWQADPLAGLCDDPEAVARAAAAWGRHSWRDCPLHEGLGIGGLDEIDDAERRRLAATFVALFDAEHLPNPNTKETT